MCGIFGIAHKNLIEKNFEQALTTLTHRGPDDSGSILLDNAVFLGHRRLSVIDLSPLGRQPMGNEDGAFWISYNGEVYNFLELRKELEGKGHIFKSRTDAEVILHLYEEKGSDCVKALNGMFAFAIYDRKKQQIFLARDRSGIKPIYYSFCGGNFIFSSEIKALLKTDIVKKEINWQAIFDYFSFLYVPCPQTAFKNIYQLSPAHYLIFDLNRQRFDITCYWKPWGIEQRKSKRKYFYDDFKQELRTLLEDAVKGQLISDVPLGCFLSGGIDSSILAALAAQYSKGRLKTFTVVFKGEGISSNDDREYALLMSRALNTDHTEIPVEVSSPEEVFSLVECFDQPFGNPTFYLSYLISKATKEFVTVAISGSGGDELFGGYPRYRVLGYAKFLSLFPPFLNRACVSLAGLIPDDPDVAIRRRMKLFVRGVGKAFPEQYLRWTYYFSDEEKKTLLKTLPMQDYPLRPSAEIINSYYNQAASNDLLNRIQYVDLNTFLADNVLEYTDKTSMAVGLETRVPYLDHRIIELSFDIPARFKIRGSHTKVILKDTFKNLLPAKILRAPKRGFCPPISIWIEKHFDFYFNNFLTPQYVQKQGVLNWDFIQVLRKQHQAKRRDNSMELFGIIMFDVWHRRYFGN